MSPCVKDCTFPQEMRERQVASLEAPSLHSQNLPGSALHGLSVEDLHRASCARVNFVVHHVLQTLVVSRAQEHLCVHLSTSMPVEQHLRKHRTVEFHQHCAIETSWCCSWACSDERTTFADLIASQVVAVLVEEVGNFLHVDGVVEGRRISDLALVGGHLAL